MAKDGTPDIGAGTAGDAAQSEAVPFINDRIVGLANDANALIVFLHVQRTGGSALQRRVLAKALGRERIFMTRDHNGKLWPDLTPADLEGMKAYAGIATFKPRDLGRPCLYISLLRHPLYRIVSLYFYIRSKEGHALRELANSLSLEEFYREASQKTPHYFRETQCRRIGGSPDASAALEAIHTHYLAIGFARNMVAFVDALAGIFHWDGVELKQRTADETRYDQLISDGFRNAVLEENKNDLQLYESMLATGSRTHERHPA